MLGEKELPRQVTTWLCAWRLRRADLSLLPVDARAASEGVKEKDSQGWQSRGSCGFHRAGRVTVNPRRRKIPAQLLITSYAHPLIP